MTTKPDMPKACEYEVGFAKPPVQTQFQKGQSGNPRGRPKGKKNVASVLQAALNERVTITENGQRKAITKLEASIKQVVNRAAAGESAAIKLLLQLFPFLDQQLEDAVQPASRQAEQQILQNLVKRMQQPAVAIPIAAPSAIPSGREDMT